MDDWDIDVGGCDEFSSTYIYDEFQYVSLAA